MTTPDDTTTFQPVKSADRTLDVLEALAAAQTPATLGELAHNLHIPKSSLHGILRTLSRRRWVEADPSGARFTLGLRALQLGTSFVDADGGVQRAQPTLDWLAEQSGETVQLARLDGATVVYLAKRGSRHPVQLISTVGSRLPAHATALGKAMLACLDTSEILRVLPARLEAVTPRTIVDRDRLVEELAVVRSRGYAVDDGEVAEGLRCFAVPVEASVGGRDAISFSVPVFRLDPDREKHLVELLKAGQERIRTGHRSGTR